MHTDTAGEKEFCSVNNFSKIEMVRLTPALAALYFFYVTLMRKIVSGPYTLEQMVLDPQNELCVDKWLLIFLYIQNYATNRMIM